ncbi:hypothetical protein [Bacteroides sedimenti]|uniref:Uncharacterized protein n=1 Tax=Bacteroides sedimenti TaxID=2136147 RepID=A0ABM8I7Z5_9BACE
MIDYLIKLDYVLGYQRFQKRENAYKPEETCIILMDLKMGNLGILSLYFVTRLLLTLNIFCTETLYSYGAVMLLFIFWMHFKMDKRIDRAPIRKAVKMMSEEEKRKYAILSYVYTFGTLLLWMLAFTWPIFVYGRAAAAH